MDTQNPRNEQPPARRDGALSNHESELLIDAVQDYAIFCLGPTGEVRSWNRGAARIFGYAARDIVGKNFSLFYLAEALEDGKPQRELRIAEEQGRVEDEGWRIRRDGTRLWVNTVITALREPNGSLHGFAKVTRDLTTHREGEDRLRRSEENLRLLIEAVQEYAIFGLDPEGTITTWNAGAHRIKGYDANEIIGKHFSIFYTPEDAARGKPKRMLDTAREHGMVEDEGWRVRKDGTRFWANVVITAVHDEHGELRGFTKVTRDVTDRRRAEEMQRSLLDQHEARLHAEEERGRAEASYRAAQEANRAKDEFLMTLSHELRTPMTAILGWARLLPLLSPDDATFRNAVGSISRAAQLQAHLIDDVLDVSRIVSGKLRLSLEVIDVVHVLQASVETVRASADAKLISITTDFDPDLGSVVFDPTRLQQIVWNLLTNAVKYTPKHGRVMLSAQGESSHVKISVSDTGEGIEETFLPHVFEPFRQGENPKTRIHGGLGLGLSIVRYLVEAHGGTVSAESAGRGKGSTFTVVLPVRAMVPHTMSDTIARTSESVPEPPQPLSGVEILLVDDDREGRELVRAALRRGGASVTAVESAEAALHELDMHTPAIVLTDLAMPVMDGYTLARIISQRPSLAKVRIVALSAFPAKHMAANDVSFAAYLSKPIDPFELVDRIAAVAKSLSSERL